MMWFLLAGRVTLIAVFAEIPERGERVMVDLPLNVVSMAPVNAAAWEPVSVKFVLIVCFQVSW